MKTQVLAVLCAALLSLIAAPVVSLGSELGCEGPQGPIFSMPEAGLYTADLISDRGNPIGIVETFNTQDSVVFILKPNPDIDLTDMQLWVGNNTENLTG